MINTIIQKSSEFLKKVLIEANADLHDYFDFFKGLTANQLDLLTHSQKLVLWINLYNTIMQIELRQMGQGKMDTSVFTKPIFTIANQKISLDFIEHGILRNNKFKYGFGYFKGTYLNEKTKKWPCSNLDARIHFQLNCGATSCPVIRILTEENLEFELKEGQEYYIYSDTSINHEKKKLFISQLFLFYRRDFGGRKEIKNLIHKFHPFPNYKLRYQKWNWEIQKMKIKY